MKTVCWWANAGIAVKIRHGVYDLKPTLINWREYQQCIFEGATDPMALWQIRRDHAWSSAHPLPPFDDLTELRDIRELEVEVTLTGEP